MINRILQNKRKFQEEEDTPVSKYNKRAYLLFWNDHEEIKNEELQSGVENGLNEKKIS